MQARIQQKTSSTAEGVLLAGKQYTGWVQPSMHTVWHNTYTYIHPYLYVFTQEEANKVDRQAEEEEKQKMAAAVWNFDGHPRRFREILSRRKKKKGVRDGGKG